MVPRGFTNFLEKGKAGRTKGEILPQHVVASLDVTVSGRFFAHCLMLLAGKNLSLWRQPHPENTPPLKIAKFL